MTGTSVVDALNIPKVIGIFASLIISPIVGLVIAGGLIFLLRRYWSGTKNARVSTSRPQSVKRKTVRKAAVLDPYRADPVCYWRVVLSRC